MDKYLLLIAVVIVAVVAEPPPQRNYLPPQARNGPSSTYGAPSVFAPQGNGPAPVYGAPNKGRNGQQDDQAEPANYQFQWEVKDPESGNDYSHQESRQGDQAQGSYQVLLPDGRTLIVEYEANQDGYHPKIRYEGEANNNGNGGYQRGPQGPY